MQNADAGSIPMRSPPCPLPCGSCIYTPSNTWRVLTSIGNVISEHTDRASAEAFFKAQKGKVLLVSPENRIVARHYKPANG